jgi:hypothetical protein
MKTVEVYLERGAKRVFACAYEWPGWCRSGKTEEMALEAMGSYADRYRIVTARAGVEFDPGPGLELQVRERLSGTTTTDFGAPAVVPAADLEPLEPRDAERLAALVKASWRILENVVSRAPSELTKGPRGGGRNRDAIVAHVVAAEYAYARKLGIREIRAPAASDSDAVEAMRREIERSLSRASDGPVVAMANWPARYGARRIAWHVLDHAWEIEDRSHPDSVRS